MAVRRGCGTRVQGGAYAECGLSAYGKPIEDFLLEPPLIPPMDVPAIGVQTFIRDGVTHVLDRIGSEHYPNVADFVEEVQRFGLSRRLAKNFPFEQLSAQSKIFVLHERAWISEDAANHYPNPGPCPKLRDSHGLGALCIGTWWDDLDRERGEIAVDEITRAAHRTMPSFSYSGWVPIHPPTHDQYKLAIFAGFPIHNIAVIRGNGHEETLERAQRAKVSVTEEDE